MSKIAPIGRLPFILRAVSDRTNGVRGRFFSTYGGFMENQPLPTDPVGLVTLTFSGVKPGSEIKIIDIDRNILAGTESASASPAFTLSRYAQGSANNTVRILVIALGYEVLDITYPLPAENTILPIFQRIDRNYRNPA